MTPEVSVFSLIVSTFNVELQLISPSTHKLFMDTSTDEVIVACLAFKAACNPVTLDITISSSKAPSASQSPTVLPTNISCNNAFPIPFPATSNVLAYSSQ